MIHYKLRVTNETSILTDLTSLLASLRWMGILSFLTVIFCLGILTPAKSQSLIDEYNECAIECFGQKEYDSAISFYSEIIALNPMDEAAYFDRGFVKDLLEDYDGAIQDFTQQIAIDPEHVDSYFLRGMIWDKKKEYAKAALDYTSVIQLEDGNADAHYFRGILKEKENDLAGAYIDYSDAIRVNSDHVDGYIHRAWLNIQQKSFAEAEKDLERAIAIDSSNVQAYYYLGFIQAERRQFDLALLNYLKAARINPFYELDYPVMAMKKHALRDYTVAMNKLVKFPSIPHQDLALLYHYLKNEDAALKHINLAIAADNENTPSKNEQRATHYFLSARIHTSRNELTFALQDITSAIDLNPNNAFHYYNRALIYMELGDYMKACSDYETELRIEGYARWWIIPSPCTN
jgi:tetratricopeptide (TPR) repeat protein